MEKTINGVELQIGPFANLRGANLIDANLIDANLSGADLRRANLVRSTLCDADLNCVVISFRGRQVKVRFEDVSE